MSSDYSFIALLASAQTNLFRFGGPILMIIGIVGCILNLLVFTKKNLRKNPCSIYLIAFNVASLIKICVTVLTATLQNGYQVDPSLYNLSFCHFRYYAILLFDILSPSYLILAAVDRILLTSRNALTRQRSTPRLAFTCIITVTLFWLLCHSHALVFTNIIQITPYLTLCYYQPGTYIVLITYYSVIVLGILVPLVMIILGWWTVKNVQKLNRIGPVSNVPATGTTGNGGLRSANSKDRQLIRMLLVDVIIYLIFNLMISVVRVYGQITQNPLDSLVETITKAFLTTVGDFSAFIPYCIGCYTNLLVSKTFRHEIKQILMCK